jgi:hypothetical protein
MEPARVLETRVPQTPDAHGRGDMVLPRHHPSHCEALLRVAEATLVVTRTSLSLMFLVTAHRAEVADGEVDKVLPERRRHHKADKIPARSSSSAVRHFDVV